MTETFLVTGGAGAIGSALVRHLSNRDDSIIITIDNLSAGQFSNIIPKKNIIFIKGDILKFNR